MKITLEISVEELMQMERWNSIKQQIKRTLFEEQKVEPEQKKEEQPLQATTEEDLKVLADLKEKLGQESEQEIEGPTAKIDVLIDGEGWKTFENVDEAANAIDARREHLLFALENNKTCNGMRVKYHIEEVKSNKKSKSFKVEKRLKEYPDTVVEIYDSIRKCANLNEIGYVTLSKNLRGGKPYEFGPYIFKLVEEIDETIKQINEDNKKPYEISKK